jgi:hypothetical protein
MAFSTVFDGFWTTSLLGFKKEMFRKAGELSARNARNDFCRLPVSYPGTESPYEHLVKTELAQLQKVLLQQHTSHGYVYLPYGTCVFNAVRALEPH